MASIMLSSSGVEPRAPTYLHPTTPRPEQTFVHALTRRAMLERHPSKRLSRRPPALSPMIQGAWTKETDYEDEILFVVPRQKKPRLNLPPTPQNGRILRPTPDSRRVNPKRDLDSLTTKVMREHLGELGNIHYHALALSGFHGGMDAHWAALDEAYERIDEEEQAERKAQARQRGALDLAIPHAQSQYRESEGRELPLPDFTIIRGSMPVSPGQGIPSTPVPDSPRDAPEIEQPLPFRGHLFGSQWQREIVMSARDGRGRPASAQENQSKSRKEARVELDIELARKQRPATVPVGLPNSLSSEPLPRSKRMGVILDGPVVRREIKRRYGAYI